ncbi:PH domain-containing protein [Microbacterium esteraromaticum]|uniref:PH domain-containing protein n=1 Tax=Microbacterium esteraromaticum TaxID=57043 RepID=A0A939DVJ6_9MICO|nr:PH domain-containing protein [Microbacterium esteraromaticum]MBN8205680.1 PH domain-containing protein [Microbacterium esteraromaticum]MBN8415834.1 PH domain-containing protein [Microbacterium esteraromaticum]WDH79798.1 PH domain-containing protein [Microbacterium esteraromaticum]
MTQPVMLGGRPMMPPPGAPAEELIVARFRGHARRLFWSALVLIAVFGATAYLYGNLPSPYENWMLLAAAGLLVLLLVVAPYLRWLSRTYTITTRRVIVRDGLGARSRQELSHTRGYSIAVRRGLLQRLWGAGTVVLSNGVDAPLRLVNVPSVNLVHEALADQVEVNQILAHRDAEPGTF